MEVIHTMFRDRKKKKKKKKKGGGGGGANNTRKIYWLYNYMNNTKINMVWPSGKALGW